MKLTNKLIPLATVATAASIVTPLSLVSCGSISLTDITNMATPSFSQYSGSTTIDDIESATTQYTAWCLDPDNQKDFIEDMKWGIYQNWISYFEQSNFNEFTYDYQVDPMMPPTTYYTSHHGILKSLQFGISKISFDTVVVGQPSSEETITLPTLSCKMKVIVKGEVNSNCSEKSDTEYYEMHKTTLNCDIEYKDMPFFVYSTIRSDKTMGHNTGPGTMFGQQWFVTTCLDSSTQEFHRFCPRAFSVKYNIDYADDVTKVINLEPSQNTEERRGNVSGDINSATKLEALNKYKDYSWNSNLHTRRMNASETLGNPGTGWKSWIQNDPQSLVANAVLLDNATHYFKPGEVPLSAETGNIGFNLWSAIAEHVVQSTQWPVEVPGFGISIPSGSSQFDENKIRARFGYMGANGFEEESWGRIEEESTSWSEDQRHYHGGGDPISIELVNDDSRFCSVESWGMPTPGGGDKVFLRVPAIFYNMDGYEFEGPKYISNDLVFHIPTEIHGNAPAIKFYMPFNDGEKTCVLDFSKPQMSHDMTFTIAK